MNAKYKTGDDSCSNITISKMPFSDLQALASFNGMLKTTYHCIGHTPRNESTTGDRHMVSVFVQNLRQHVCLLDLCHRLCSINVTILQQENISALLYAIWIITCQRYKCGKEICFKKLSLTKLSFRVCKDTKCIVPHIM